MLSAVRVPPPVPSKLRLLRSVTHPLNDMLRRDFAARLGPKEIKVFDVGDRRHAVWVWDLREGGIQQPSGLLEPGLKEIQHHASRMPAGGILLLEPSAETSALISFPVDLPNTGDLHYARVHFPATGDESLIDYVRRMTGDAAWSPHPVAGVHDFYLNDSSHGFASFQCLASSRHTNHREAHPMKNSSPGFLVSAMLNPLLGDIPSIDAVREVALFDSSIGLEQGLRLVLLIAHPLSEGLGLTAWAFTDTIDLSLVRALQEELDKAFPLRADPSSLLLSIPEELIQRRIQMWSALFADRLENKSLVRVSLETEYNEPLRVLPFA